MDFIIYIDKMGVDKLAEKLNTTAPSVYQWKQLLTAPRPMMAYAIIELSGGLLDFNDIYSPYVNNKLASENPNQIKLEM